MKDETIENQNELIELIEQAGWSVSSVETREHEYKAPRKDEITDVSIKLVVSMEYGGDDDFENPYRIK